jgi:hypothetical protein
LIFYGSTPSCSQPLIKFGYLIMDEYIDVYADSSSDVFSKLVKMMMKINRAKKRFAHFTSLDRLFQDGEEKFLDEAARYKFNAP